MKHSRHKYCRGQAIAEVVIGLVGMTVIFFGLLQIAQLGNASIENLLEARSEADDYAQGNQLSIGSSYVGDWSNGADGLRHTADDVAEVGFGDGLTAFQTEVDSPLSLSSLAQNTAIGMHDGFSTELETNSLVLAANLFESNETRTLSVEPALQSLLLGAFPELTLNDHVVMAGLDIDTGAP